MGDLRVGITGASGFVGQHLNIYLQQRGVKVVELKLREGYRKENLQGLSALIHLAGKAHDLKGKAELDDYIAANTKLTSALYTDFLGSEVPVFFYMSSVKAVMDYSVNLLTEDMPAMPTTSYGISKQQAEAFILAQQPNHAKRAYILRPCMIHGPGNKGNLNLLYKVAKLGMPYPLASFENQRSFLSIENLCFVIRELIERTDIPSGVYNVSDDAPLSTNRIIQIMSETILKRPRLWKINKSFIKGIARMGDFLPFPLNSERLQKLTESYVVSNAKLLTALNKPLPVSSEEGLRKTIQSFVDGK